MDSKRQIRIQYQKANYELTKTSVFNEERGLNYEALPSDKTKNFER